MQCLIYCSHSDAHCLKQCLQEQFFTELHKIEVDGERVPMPQPIPWYIGISIVHVRLCVCLHLGICLEDKIKGVWLVCSGHVLYNIIM